VHLPASSLVTIDSEIVQDFNIPKDVTVQGSIAAAWTLNYLLGDERKYQIWEATWPSQAEVKNSMPFFWEKKYQDLLPPAARSGLRSFQKEALADKE
jgi:hypothetical protein